MPIILSALWPLERANDAILTVCRWVSIALLAVMVCFILGQVFFRYVLNDAPAWTEEAARFGMIWMTGLMAPVAYRRGGFVAIDMAERALPPRASAALTLVLLGISLWVLAILWDKGLNNHVDSLSGRGNSSSLRFEWNGEMVRFKNQYQYAGLWVGINLLILVSVELILRQLAALLGAADRLRPLAETTAPSAE
ncbi:MAG: TRAP transporter small permease [Paracoccaceae bacterium]